MVVSNHWTVLLELTGLTHFWFLNMLLLLWLA